MNRHVKTWIEIHALLSVFFLPVALIYAVTGGLYIAGVRPHRPKPPVAMSMQVPSQSAQPMPPGEGRPGPGSMGQGQPMPPGEGGPGAGSMEQFRGGESGMRPRGHMKPSGLYDQLMMLHAAKGGPIFNILGVLFAVSMLIMYVSGLVVYWAAPSRRRRMLEAAALGLVVAIVAVVLSL